MAVIQQGIRQKRQTYTFPEVASAGFQAGRTDWLDVGEFPTSSLHVFPAAGTPTFTVDVEISNVDGPGDPGAFEVAQADVAASTVIALTKGARYVRLRYKTLTGTGAKLGAIWHGALQS